MFELFILIIGGILSISLSLIFEVIFIFLKKKNESKDDNITFRIKEVSEKLEGLAEEISELQDELEKRIQLVEKLQKEAEEAENIISLTENQVKAVRTTLNNELKKEGQKSFWKGVVVNFIFFVLGAFISFIFSKFLV